MTARQLATPLASLLVLAALVGAPAEAQTPSGKWKGTYVCAQGETGITLTLASVGAGAVRAFMEFYATPDNPKVPSGRYTLDGAFEPASDRLRLTPDYWVEQPAGYVMVGFDGRMTGDRFSGQVFGHPSCTTFAVVRHASPL